MNEDKNKNNKTRRIELRLTEEEFQRVDELAKEAGVNRSRMIRNLTLGYVDSTTIKVFRKTGFLKAVIKMVDKMNNENKEIISYPTNEDYEKATGKKIGKHWTDIFLK